MTSVPRRAVLSLFGVGFVPGPSGTYASLATALAVALVDGERLTSTSPALLVALAFGVVSTLLLGNAVVDAAGHGDPSWVVTDEVAGQALAMGIAFAAGHGSLLATTGLSFVLFRVFDITKPGPVGAAERLPGGLGILADDLVAGAIAGVLVAGVRATGLLG